MTNSNTTPKVSIVMPAYNAEAFIGEVLATIVGQTFTDFELIIIDDGSTDDTKSIIKKYSDSDSRIKYFHQKNKGSKRLAETINTGISKAQAELIARADADDPWFLDKLQKQVDFMDSHPDYAIVGGAAEVTDERGMHLYTLLGPIEDDDNRRSLTLYTTLAHGSVMFRKSSFNKAGGYENIHAAEDLKLWQTLSDFGKIYNIPEVLFKYRKNTQGISLSNSSLQARIVTELGNEYFESHTPSVLSVSELRKRSDSIEKFRGNPNTPPWYIDELQRKLLEDNRQIAKKIIQYGNKRAGYRQMTNIALSSNKGLALMVRSIRNALRYRFKVLLGFRVNNG